MTLEERRQKAGLRQKDVAERLEVDQSAVSKWENGMMPLKKYRAKLAEIFECSEDDLFRSADK